MTNMNDQEASDDAANTLSGFDPMMLIATWDEELKAVHSELTREFNPTTFIVRMYVEDLANIYCEGRRLNRYKIAIQRGEMVPALQTILEQILTNKDYLVNLRSKNDAKRLAAGSLINEKAQLKIETLLVKSALTAVNVEAEAWRSASDDLALIERMLASLEYRRDKVLANIARYQPALVQDLKDAGERIVETEEAPLIPRFQL